MKKFLIVIGLLGMINPLNAQIKVACIGNSITAGNQSDGVYPKILQNLLGNGYNVENMGQSGSKMCFSSNSAWVKLKWPGPDGIKFHQPNIITIKLGTNDAQASTWANCKSDYKKDYIKLIDSLYKWVKIKPKIFLCLPTPSTDDNDYNIKGSTIKNEIIPMIKEIAKELNLSVIDLNTPFIAKQSTYFYDGVHPTFEGTTEIAKLIYKAITSITSIEEHYAEQLYVLSPNPVSQSLKLETKAIDLPTQIMLYDAIGNIVMTNNIQEAIQFLDVSALKSGLYYFKINNMVQKITILK